MQLITVAPALTARFAEENLPVKQIAGRNTGVREAWGLYGVLRDLKAEAIVVDTPRDLRLAALATLLHRARIVYRYNLNYRSPRDHLADRLYASRVAACVFQSAFIEDAARRQERWVPRVPGFRVANGYDTTRFVPRLDAAGAFRRKWNIRPDAFVMLTSAKLERNKGHDDAFEALSRVRQDSLDFTYVVCGNGSREAELQARAADLGLPVRFTGLLHTDELIGALSAADLVIHPALNEIFPNAVGEAMACSRAVVAVDAGGTAELLGTDGSAGILVPPGDPATLAGEIVALANDSARRRRLGTAARSRIETRFDLSRMIDGYEAVLQHTIGHG